MTSFPLKSKFARIALVASIVIFISCDSIQRNNPDDPSSSKYSVFPVVEQSSSSAEVPSSSSEPSSSSLATYTLACAAVPSTGIVGIAITPPVVTCNGMVVSIGLDWTGEPNWSNPAMGTYGGISVLSSYGECYGKTANCSGTLTVEAAPLPDELTCTGMPATGVFGTAVTQPTVRCGSNTVATGITWEDAPASWANPAAATYNVSATASCGGSSKTASCGTLTIASVLACSPVPSTSIAGIAINPPVVTCNGAAVSSGLNWTNAPNWSAPAAGTYSEVSVSASSGECSEKTASCGGTLTVAQIYTVAYNAGIGGTGLENVKVPDSQTKKYDVDLRLNSGVLNRIGYEFAGWNTSPDGTGISYSPGANYSENADLTLYAQWVVNTYYTVTYNANGGTGAPDNQTKTHDVALTLRTTKPTRTGYAFMGWNTSDDGSGTFYASGTSYTVNAGVTLYAQWVADTYTITYYANDGTDEPYQTKKIHDIPLTLSAQPTREGLLFAGWNTSPYGQGTLYSLGSLYTDNENITLYAQWKVSFTCGNDNKTFTVKAVTIGNQTWMAENLNCNVSGSKCGNGSSLSDANTATCDTYGRLYNWATAMGIDAKYNNQSWGGSDVRHKGVCPTGWHLPSNAEWTTLTDFVGGSSTAGTKLKATTGWNSYSGVPAGTDAYGFSALPGGLGSSGGYFDNVGRNGYWWSASELNSSSAYRRYMGYRNEDAGYNNYPKYYLFSVRCLQD